MTARILDVTSAEYHADPCETPSLSASVAIELILRSPLHAWRMHPRLGGIKRAATEAMDDGTLIHALTLGKGEERVAVLAVDDFRTKAAKEARDAALAEGKTVIKAADFEDAKLVAEKIKKRLADKYGISFDGLSEQAIEWREPIEDGDPVLCRCKMDHVVVRFTNVTEATVYDLKTIRRADLRTVQSHINQYGYDIQEAAYRSAIEAISPESRGRVDFVFLFAEIDSSGEVEVTPVRLTGLWRALGEDKWRRACRTWAQCLRTKTWPGYVDCITEIEPPPWALTG